MILPNEILLEIYNYSDIQTKIKLNKAFKWSFYHKNPFYNILYNQNKNKNKNISTKIASYKGFTVILP